MGDLAISIETFIRNGIPPRIRALVDEILCNEVALTHHEPGTLHYARMYTPRHVQQPLYAVLQLCAKILYC